MTAASLWRLKMSVASLALTGIFVGGFQSEFLRIFSRDRAQISAYYTELPYRKLPGLRRFLVAVHERTITGDAIALLLDKRRWNDGYQYGYYRSVYLLGGRRVLPLLDRHDQFLGENLNQSRYLACWRCEPDPRLPFDVVLRTPDGVLAVRR